jgi:hypothetical protein
MSSKEPKSFGSILWSLIAGITVLATLLSSVHEIADGFGITAPLWLVGLSIFLAAAVAASMLALTHYKASTPNGTKWIARSLLGVSVLALGFSIGLRVAARRLQPPCPHRATAGNLVKDFDSESLASGWPNVEVWNDKWELIQTIEQAAFLRSLGGEREIDYKLQLKPGEWLYHLVRYIDPVQADIVIAQVYLPETSDIETALVRLVATDEPMSRLESWTEVEIPLGKWTQVALDLRGQYDTNDVPLSTRKVYIDIYYAIRAAVTATSGMVEARLADVAFYKDVGFQPVQEQRGLGRTLFDFEGDYGVEGWQVASSPPGQTNTIGLSFGSEPVCRGYQALKLDTDLDGEHSVLLYTTLRAYSSQDGWVAQLHLPDDAPDGTSLWVHFYTYSESGWQAGQTLDLVKGRWNTLIGDMRGIRLEAGTEIQVGLQIGTNTGGHYRGPIYIDDIQLFQH